MEMYGRGTNRDLWYTTSFTGHWPLGVCALVVAPTAKEAAVELNVKLQAMGLPGDATAETMFPIEQAFGKSNVAVIVDGNY